MAHCLGRFVVHAGAGFQGLLSAGAARQFAGASCSAYRTSQLPTRVASAAAPHASWSPSYRAVLVDAAGTFLIPSEPVADVYLRYARPAGCTMNGVEVVQRFRRAYNTPWGASALRYVGDARPFWRYIVRESTGCNEPEVFEAIYDYYARPEAWRLMPGAVEALQRLKSAGVLLAVVSNFDTRLRPLLARLGVEGLFDAVIVSAEVLAEKPNPVIFDAAVRALSAAAITRGTLPIASSPSDGPFRTSVAAAPYSGGNGDGAFNYGSLVSGQQPLSLRGLTAAGLKPDFAPLAPEQVVHVGDDRRNDCWGARDAGLMAWQWGYDVRSWAEVADRVLLGSQVDDYYDNLSYEATGA